MFYLSKKLNSMSLGLVLRRRKPGRSWLVDRKRRSFSCVAVQVSTEACTVAGFTASEQYCSMMVFEWKLLLGDFLVAQEGGQIIHYPILYIAMTNKYVLTKTRFINQLV